MEMHNTTQKPSNLVFIVPDEYRPFSMGFLGVEPVSTPNLDAFAHESVHFPHAISNYPVCTPYRGMLFTGQYPMHSGITTNCRSVAPVDCHWSGEHQCLSDILKNAGYDLGYIGKLHLDNPTEEDALYGEGPRPDGVVWDAYTPPDRRHGFNYWHSYGCCDNHLKPHYWIGDVPAKDPTFFDEWSPIHETDVATSYIENKNGERDPQKPFALFVAYNPPHMPFHQVPVEYLEIYKGASPQDLLVRQNLTKEGFDLASPHIVNYFSMVSGIDDQFGRILSSIENAHIKDSTTVIFTSDHGEMMGSHGRMHKDVWYEESLRVPFLIRFPDGTGKGTTNETLFGVPDLHATLLGLLGVPHGNDACQGVDLASAFRFQGNSSVASVPYMCMNQHQRIGVRSTRFTYVVERKGQELTSYLYDNQEDPYQLKNIIGTSPSFDREQRELLKSHLTVTGNPWPEIAL